MEIKRCLFKLPALPRNSRNILRVSALGKYFFGKCENPFVGNYFCRKNLFMKSAKLSEESSAT